MTESEFKLGADSIDFVFHFATLPHQNLSRNMIKSLKLYALLHLIMSVNAE